MDLEKQIRSAEEMEPDCEPWLCCTKTCAFIFVCLIVISACCFLILWLGSRADFNTITASVSLGSVDYVSTTRGSASLNATFNVRIELKNHGVDSDVSYGDTAVFLRHKGANLGAFPIPGAHVEENLVLGVLLTLVSNANNTSSSALYSDVVSGGVLKLQTYVRFIWKWRSAMVFKVRSVAEATCDVWIDLSSRALSYGECHENPPETKEGLSL